MTCPSCKMRPMLPYFFGRLPEEHSAPAAYHSAGSMNHWTLNPRSRTTASFAPLSAAIERAVQISQESAAEAFIDAFHGGRIRNENAMMKGPAVNSVPRMPKGALRRMCRHI